METLAYIAEFPAIYLSLATILGLMVGSFLNVVIYRLPIILERDWRSQCHEVLGNEVPKKSWRRRQHN